MAKRPWDLTQASEKVEAKPSTSRQLKRSKSNGKSRSKVDTPDETDVSALNGTITESPSNGTSDSNHLSKAERKALRRQKKNLNKAAAIQNSDQNATSTGLEDGNVEQEQQSPADKVATKLAIDSYYQENHVTVQDSVGSLCAPMQSFDELSFDAGTTQQFFRGFTAPTPIQAASWPYLLQGRDLVGVAETGSGKTFAFGVPCIQRLDQSRKCIRACIVSPTRELALQIHEQMNRLAEPRGVKVTCVYGGVNKDEQRRSLKHTEILVATPGRLNDFVGDGVIDLSAVNYLVLDEADRMLDKGFEEDVRKIIEACAPSGLRQTLMFTATWPPSIRDLASEYLRDPVKITIGRDAAAGELRANAKIVQEVEVVEEHEKLVRMLQLLKQYQSGKHRNDRILLFCLYKKEATRIEEFIRRKGFPVAGINGDLSQHRRTESLELFKSGKVPLLVATDVAARGLDIPAVKLVLNVTFPLTVEDYVHRIGRTGRAGQDGRAITLFTQNEKGLAGALINVLKAADQPVPDALLKFGTTVKKKAHDAYGAFFRDNTDGKKATKITFDD